MAEVILFPGGDARLSTIALFAAFITLGLARKSWLPIVACFSWLFGFELAFDLVMVAFGRPAPLDEIHFVVYAIIGVAGPIYLLRRGIHPTRSLLAVSLLLWGVWIAAGFHINYHTMVNFDPLSEVLNEGAKIAWALAYLIPLWATLARGLSDGSDLKELPSGRDDVAAAASLERGRSWQSDHGRTGREADARHV